MIKHLFTLQTFFIFLMPMMAQKEIKLDNSKLKPENYSGLSLRAIGPAVTSGRISDFAINPKNYSEYYVAASAGGVWKTSDRGITFQPIFDNEGSYSIGCITIDPSNTSTIWVGSGENNNQRSVSYGDGVYKSDDGGKSWKNMGLKNSEHIAKIIISPDNSDIVYVAAYGPVWKEGGERGVYKSIDGGQTWSCVKSVSQYTGCNEIAMDPRNPNVLYAAFHQRMRKVFTYIGGGPESALFKTTDAGKTWKKLEGGLPSGDIGRIGLALSNVSPDVLYAVVEAYDGKGGIYRSIDGGASWEKRSGTYTSGNYYQEVMCDPQNADKLFISDTYFKVSYDGGKTVSNLGEINKHIDNHAIWIDPQDTKHLLVGCDGGIYETYDHAGSWDFKSNLPVTQFYKVSTDNDYPFYGVHGGTQDNLSLGGPSRTTSGNGIVNSDWYVTSIGDGFETQVDPTDPNIVYAQAQYGALTRYDKRNGEYLYIKPVESEDEEGLRWNWDAPLLISSHDHKRLYLGANKIFRTDDQGQSWKEISPDLSRQTDRNTFEVMDKIWSVDAIAKNQSTDIYGQTTTIAESALDENLLWVGTDDGLIQVTTDGGKNWTKVDNINGVPKQCYVHQIITSLYDKNTAYACFNNHRFGDFKPYVLKTTDMGKTWTAIQNDLPERGSVYSIAEDHVDKNLLFVGTEFGLYFTNSGGKNWYQLKAGLPIIAVRDLDIQRRESDLVLATFGRGFYILDDYSALRNINNSSFEQEAKIFPIKDGLMYIERYPLGLRSKGHMGSSYFATPNPEVGTIFTYFIKDDIKTKKEIRREKEKEQIKKGEKITYPSLDSLREEDNDTDPFILFTISDKDGDIIRHLKVPSKKGMNRITWDFRYGSPAPINNRFTPAPDQLFGSEDIGHLVMPGTYYVKMSKYVEGKISPITENVAFECKLLQNGSLQSKDMAENVAFYEKVNKLNKHLNVTSDLLSKMDGRISNIYKALPDMPAKADDIIASAYTAKQKLVQLKEIMYGDATRSKREFETSPSINDRVVTIVSSVWNSTSAIPKTYQDSYEIANKQFNKTSLEIEALDKEIKIIEEEMEKRGGVYLGR